jgi:hypothetical protein
MADDLEHARKRLDDEYGQIRRRFDDIHERFDRVVSAGPEDDLRGMLKDLEKRVRKIRTGGLFRHGANGHARALRKYQQVKGETGGSGAAPSEPKVTKF